jgi:hypothetical protein
LRGSRTVLREAGGEVPLVYSPAIVEAWEQARSTWMCKCRWKKDAGATIASYVTVSTTQKTNKKTSKTGGLFVASCLSADDIDIFV